MNGDNRPTSAEIKKEYYPRGELKNERTYVNGVQEGISKTYYLSGKLKSEINYINGEMVGLGKGYYESGKIEAEANYKNGKLEGFAKGYYENGKLKWDRNYKNGKQEGIDKGYYESGKLSLEKNYKNDKLEGIFKGYHENGKLKSEINYINGEMVGLGKGYYESGRLLWRATFKNGKAEGISNEYNENGNIEVEGNYQNGKREGLKKRYYENGKLKAEFNSINDKLEGESKHYYQNGECQYIDTFRNDKRINRKEYTREGQLKLDQDYQKAIMFSFKEYQSYKINTDYAELFAESKFRIVKTEDETYQKTFIELMEYLQLNKDDKGYVKEYEIDASSPTTCNMTIKIGEDKYVIDAEAYQITILKTILTCQEIAKSDWESWSWYFVERDSLANTHTFFVCEGDKILEDKIVFLYAIPGNLFEREYSYSEGKDVNKLTPYYISGLYDAALVRKNYENFFENTDFGKLTLAKLKNEADLKAFGVIQPSADKVLTPALLIPKMELAIKELKKELKQVKIILIIILIALIMFIFR